MNLSTKQCEQIGLGAVGKNCLIHETVQFFSPRNVFIGDNVRIDCFCILSAGEQGIRIEDHIHIGAGTYLLGSGGRIVLEAFSGLAPRVSLFTASDDFVEGYLHGPNIPMTYRKVKTGNVILRVNAIVGAGSVVLPGVTVGLNAAVGPLSVVSKDVPDHDFKAGNPARRITCRDAALWGALMERFEQEYAAKSGENTAGDEP